MDKTSQFSMPFVQLYRVMGPCDFGWWNRLFQGSAGNFHTIYIYIYKCVYIKNQNKSWHISAPMKSPFRKVFFSWEPAYPTYGWGKSSTKLPEKWEMLVPYRAYACSLHCDFWGPNRHTFSLFVNGKRVGRPQLLPEKLRDTTLWLGGDQKKNGWW